MKEEAKSELGKIIGAYEEKLSLADRLETAKRAADAAFPARFLEFSAKTVRPELQEIADMLNKGGHEASVRDQAESSGAGGGVRSAAVSLHVVPKPFAHKGAPVTNVAIEVAFSASRTERKVIVSSTNSMTSHRGNVGKRGEYAIDQLTPEVVANHVIQTLHDAFAGEPAPVTRSQP